MPARAAASRDLKEPSEEQSSLNMSVWFQFGHLRMLVPVGLFHQGISYQQEANDREAIPLFNPPFKPARSTSAVSHLQATFFRGFQAIQQQSVRAQVPNPVEANRRLTSGGGALVLTARFYSKVVYKGTSILELLELSLCLSLSKTI